MIEHVVIVGGGTAGWLSAGMIAANKHKYSNSTPKITLIESPNIKTLGVGEGTWPSMRNTLQQIGINEREFIKSCNVSLKQGSQFKGWRDGSIQDSYYHPFITPPGYYECDLHTHWQSLAPEMPFADFVSVQSCVCDHKKAPKQFATPDYAGVTNYGYHLDASKFAELLKDHCTDKLNVNYICDDVIGVNTDDNNNITSLVLAKHDELHLDLVIDCSGMHSLLIDKHYGVEFQRCDDVLFNDSALATHLPYSDDNEQIESATVATAQEAGWTWDIGLQTRRGVGYTYSSRHSTDEQAEQVLRDYIRKTSNDRLAQSVDVRKISFTPGYRKQFWVKNCLAVGMSAGFFEPLEASALAMVELSLTMLTEEFPVDHNHMTMLSERFNNRFTYRWQRVVDFLKLHYLFNTRDEPYWVDARDDQSTPNSLKQLLQIWQYQAPNRHDLTQNEEVFPSASYQYVLYGLGFIPKVSKTLSLAQQQQAQRLFQQNRENQSRFIQALPGNRELVTHIKSKVA
ncbi:tryptophan halogenase family protein [Glaciecola sp. KUL10]|uniref:tryptophan halogenase family protein n=1 Tax=Glaciecola sp. (strain KUL10) TaxID=2161813 RepID=UPI000D8D00AF|nr:tryptophan halogenase family protein [Glaciecola sp. KUL10]GBL05927.1 tryptophan halogenase [Glaciecola sp. KUL10]